jgi:hypothetical protein
MQDGLTTKKGCQPRRRVPFREAPLLSNSALPACGAAIKLAAGIYSLNVWPA